MLRSSRQSSILPNHSDYDGMGNFTVTANAMSNHIYSPNKKTRNPYSSYSNDPFADALQILSDRLKQTSSWLLIGLAFFGMMTAYYRSQFQWVLDELQIESIDQIVTSYQHMQSNALWKEAPLDRVQRFEQENMKLQKEKQEMKFYYESKAKNEYRERKNEEYRMATREEAWKSQVELLKKATARESRRAVLDKFGEGPHHVEFTFILPDDESEIERTFTVETAPLDLMPHAVHLFLEQVYHELWDRAWFYLNGPHVLQAGPMLDEEEYEHLGEAEWEQLDERAAVLKPFTERDLESLAFPEYSEKFPHVEWTMGFAGRPGGPDWYINKSDNTRPHGPGGQYQHDLDEQADSCFAKVVSGFDQLELIFKEPTIEEGSEWEYFLMEPTYIVQARIVDLPEELLAFNQLTNNTQPAGPLDHSPLHKSMHKSHIDHQVAP